MEPGNKTFKLDIGGYLGAANVTKFVLRMGMQVHFWRSEISPGQCVEALLLIAARQMTMSERNCLLQWTVNVKTCWFQSSMDMISRLDTGLVLPHIAIFIYPYIFIKKLIKKYI